VKNFPNSWTRDDLLKLFNTYGDIENIRVDKSKNTGNAFAFVCYKEPTDAAKAKQNLQSHNCEGKMLLINYYEIKEVRKLQMEEARDKADWEKYQAQQTGGLKWNDLTSQPHLAQMLQQLLGIIQYNEQTNQQMNQGEQHMRRRQYNQGPRHYQRGMGGQNMHHQQNMQHHQNQGGMGGQQQNMGMGQMQGNMPPNQRMMQQQ
jgi:RNA recognition motif-containing protein